MLERMSATHTPDILDLVVVLTGMLLTFLFFWWKVRKLSRRS